MRNLLLLSIVWWFNTATTWQNHLPDLNNKNDLKSLGTGRIIEPDKTIIKNIALFEVNTYWIVYIKNGSLHEMNMENIAYIEFKETQWGPLKITFKNNKPQIVLIEE